MGRVSLYEDINDRLDEDAPNAVVPRDKLTSIKHLPDGAGIRPHHLRPHIVELWLNFDRASAALKACNQRPIPQDPRKRMKAEIDNAIEGSWLREEMHIAWKKLAEAYPSRHPVRTVLERGLREVSRIRQ